MRLIRSWPLDAPFVHARCDDALPRIMTPPFDYLPLVQLEADVLHLDWDVAASPEQLHAFAAAAREDPEHVLLAPYLTYPGSMFGHDPVPRDLPGPVWTAKVYTDETETQMRNVTETDSHAHLFGFGMIYLPRHWLGKFHADHPGVKLGDGQFSGWYYRQAGPARICWDVRPVHLNFPPPVEL